MIEHKTIIPTVSSNVYKRAIEFDEFNELEQKNIYYCSHCFSPTSSLEDIEEYDLDLNGFDTELEAENSIKNSMLVSETMEYKDTIARYINKQGIEYRKLFYVPKEINKYLNSDVIVLAGKGKDNNVYLWFYENVDINDINSFDFIPGKPYDIWTYKSYDEVFSSEFKIEYSKN